MVGLSRDGGSDYPHDEGTPPLPASTSPGHPGPGPFQLRRVLGENAAKLYGFDLDALAPDAAQYGPTVDEIAEPLTELPEGANAALRNSAEQLAAV